MGVEVRLYDGVGQGGDAEGDTFENIEGLRGSRYDDYTGWRSRQQPYIWFRRERCDRGQRSG